MGQTQSKDQAGNLTKEKRATDRAIFNEFWSADNKLSFWNRLFWSVIISVVITMVMIVISAYSVISSSVLGIFTGTFAFTGPVEWIIAAIIFIANAFFTILLYATPFVITLWVQYGNGTKAYKMSKEFIPKKFRFQHFVRCVENPHNAIPVKKAVTKKYRPQDRLRMLVDITDNYYTEKTRQGFIDANIKYKWKSVKKMYQNYITDIFETVLTPEQKDKFYTLPEETKLNISAIVKECLMDGLMHNACTCGEERILCMVFLC